MLRKVYVFAIILLFASKMLYAFESGTLRGRVIDGFAKPLPFANIMAVSDGSKSETSSDSSGQFSVSYNLGNVKLTFNKQGYIPVYIPLSLDEKTDLSVGDITLWKIPPKGGLFAVGDGDYIEINNATYYSESNSKERRFYVKGSPMVIKGQKLTLIDFQTDNPLVVGKTLYSVDSKGSVGSITFYPPQKYLLNEERDTYTKIADNVGMRKVNLPPGRYFYCVGEITIRSKNGLGFFFEVSP
ncbi:MAG TPA: carboxypeptidase regulatory-like domain-containing protein [Candidatus Brocadiaceae bacterium]